MREDVYRLKIHQEQAIFLQHNSQHIEAVVRAKVLAFHLSMVPLSNSEALHAVSQKSLKKPLKSQS